MSNPGTGAEPDPSDSQPENEAPAPDGPAPDGPAPVKNEGRPEALDSAAPSPRNCSISWLRRFRKTLRLTSRPRLVNPNFAPSSGRYLFQAALATVAMLALLLFVDSLSQAALVAALGASVVILFVHPSSPAATQRSLIGGHSLGLILGSLFALLLFAGPVESFLEDLLLLRNLSLAVSVGLLILAMAVTGTEHPPAAGTVLGMATRPWDLETFGIIIGAVLLLAAIERLLRARLRDLI